MDRIIKDANGSIGKRELNEEFKRWFELNLGNRKIPKLSELEEVMVKKFGNRSYKTNKWNGIKFKADDEEMNDLDEINS